MAGGLAWGSAILPSDAATRRMVERLAALGRGFDRRLVAQRPEPTLARVGRPVTAPNSPPSWRSCSPAGLAASVGSGPLPTRVVYAFTTPST